MADVAIMEYKTSSKDLYLVSCGWEKCGATFLWTSCSQLLYASFYLERSRSLLSK